jgi:hypothetical protein
VTTTQSKHDFASWLYGMNWWCRRERVSLRHATIPALCRWGGV